MNNDTIILDLETTGLTGPKAMGDEYHPHIIELYMRRGDMVLSTFVKPPLPIDEKIQSITGITDAMVRTAPKFSKVFRELAEFCLGARRWVAHNMDFDRDVLLYELTRIGMQYHFPWPLEYYCTLKHAQALPEAIKPVKLNLGFLYEHVTGERHKEAHRAGGDVEALVKVYEWIVDHEAT